MKKRVRNPPCGNNTSQKPRRVIGTSHVEYGKTFQAKAKVGGSCAKVLRQESLASFKTEKAIVAGLSLGG